MMRYFKRFEKKYIIDKVQKDLLTHLIEGKLEADDRCKYTLRNLYYDTDNYDLIRASIEKPVYKEKLRLRMYQGADVSTTSFIELKKKVDGIVFKRRLKLNMLDAISFLAGGISPIVEPSDISTLMEIEHFLHNNKVMPKAYITYDRYCLKGISEPDFRMTFDSNIMYQNTDSEFYSLTDTKPIIEPDNTIMEIKTPTSIPIWLSKIMSELEIYPTSFSKYGMAYKTYVYGRLFNETNKERGVSLSA